MARYINRLKLQWMTAATSSSDDALAQRVTAQAIDFLYHNLPSVIISITLMPMVMILIMWRHIDQRLLIVWCAASFAVTAARLLLNRAYLQRTPPPQAAPRWGRYFTWTALASGLVWGGAGVLFFVPDSTAHQVFLFTSIVGLCAGSIILTNTA